jgi:hypothetical protein
VAFYRPQQWAPRVTSGLQFELVSVKRREREVLGGGLELRGAHKACWHIGIRWAHEFGGEPRGELRWLYLDSPARFRWGEVKGREGEGNWEWCSDPRASGLPRNGLACCPLANQSSVIFCLPGVCGNGGKNSECEILKISNLAIHYFGLVFQKYFW